MVTASYVRERLNYDPLTGLLTWRTAVGPRTSVGAVAGTVSAGYRHIKLEGRTYRAHRLIWLLVHGTWPTEVDHLNGDGLDNRLENLRDASRSVNVQNSRRARKDSSSGLIGAHYHKQNRKWVAAIQVNKETRYLGIFATPEEAHEVYLTAKRQLHAGCTI